MKLRMVGASLALLAGMASSVAAQAPAAAPARSATPAAGVAAIVNDDVISTYDVDQRAQLLLIGAGIAASNETLERARAQALRDLVDERLQMQETTERKVKVDAADIDRSVNDIARQNGSSVAALSANLAAAGVSIQTLRKQIEADIAWRRFMGGRYGSRIRISKVQIDEMINRITANAAKPQALVSEIKIAAESEADLQEAESIGARLLQEIRNGAPFPAVARQFSSASSAAAGGDLGWLAQGELRSELQTIVDQLQPGQVSRPVRGPGGIYIMAVRDKRAGVDRASVTRIALRQVTAPTEQRASFQRVMRRIPGCDGLEAAVAGVTGAAVVDLGEATETELSEDVRARIASVEDGAASDIYDAGDKLAALVVCARATSGDAVPSRTEVENRLYEQELALASERYLRNLRRDSTIITR